MQKDRSNKKHLIHRLFLDVLKIMIAVSAFNIIGNIAYGFPLAININMSKFGFSNEKSCSIYLLQLLLFFDRFV